MWAAYHYFQLAFLRKSNSAFPSVNETMMYTSPHVHKRRGGGANTSPNTSLLLWQFCFFSFFFFFFFFNCLKKWCCEHLCECFLCSLCAKYILITAQLVTLEQPTLLFKDVVVCFTELMSWRSVWNKWNRRIGKLRKPFLLKIMNWRYCNCSFCWGMGGGRNTYLDKQYVHMHLFVKLVGALSPVNHRGLHQG